MEKTERQGEVTGGRAMTMSIAAEVAMTSCLCDENPYQKTCVPNFGLKRPVDRGYWDRQIFIDKINSVGATLGIKFGCRHRLRWHSYIVAALRAANDLLPLYR